MFTTKGEKTMAIKMTARERELSKEVNRLKKRIASLEDEIVSLQVDLSLAKGEISLKDDDDIVSKTEIPDDLEADDLVFYSLEEIGFDTTYETVGSLLNIARYHCQSYEDRQGYLPIDTVSKAIKYLTENGFKVTCVL